jgi:hypothetical protein
VIENKELNGGYLFMRKLMTADEMPNEIRELPILKESENDSVEEKETLKKWYQFWKRG